MTVLEINASAIAKIWPLPNLGSMQFLHSCIICNSKCKAISGTAVGCMFSVHGLFCYPQVLLLSEFQAAAQRRVLVTKLVSLPC